MEQHIDSWDYWQQDVDDEDDTMDLIEWKENKYGWCVSSIYYVEEVLVVGLNYYVTIDIDLQIDNDLGDNIDKSTSIRNGLSQWSSI